MLHEEGSGKSALYLAFTMATNQLSVSWEWNIQEILDGRKLSVRRCWVHDPTLLLPVVIHIGIIDHGQFKSTNQRVSGEPPRVRVLTSSTSLRAGATILNQCHLCHTSNSGQPVKLPARFRDLDISRNSPLLFSFFSSSWKGGYCDIYIKLAGPTKSEESQSLFGLGSGLKALNVKFVDHWK